MEDNLTNRMLLGGFFSLLGLAIIVFHDRIRRFQDKINAALFTYSWTGEYTRGGLLFLRVISILFGAFFLIFGILIMAHVLV